MLNYEHKQNNEHPRQTVKHIASLLKKSSLLLFIVFGVSLLLIPAVHASGGYQWTNRTSGTALSGKVWKASASSRTGKYLAAAAYGGDIYTSADYGANWVNRTAGTSISGAIWNSITMSSDGRYLLATPASTGDIWATNDYGATWTNRTSGTALSGLTWQQVSVSPSGKYVIAVDYLYAYVSQDYGVTWAQSSTSLGTRSFNSATISSDGQHLTAVEDTTNVYGSNNGGSTWVKLTSDPSLDSVVAFHAVTASWNGKYIVSAAYGGDIYRSTDYGQNWTNATTGTPASGENWSSLRSSETGQYLVAVSDGNLYTSQDYGVTWTNQSASAPLSGHTWESAAISGPGHRILAGASISDIFTAIDPSVVPAPTVANITSSVAVNGTVTVNVFNGASGHDPNSLSIVSGPSHGVAVDPPGDITYTPNRGYSGTDSLVYRLCSPIDGAICSQGTLYFNVQVTSPSTGLGKPDRTSPIIVVIAASAFAAIAAGLFLLYRSKKSNR